MAFERAKRKPAPVPKGAPTASPALSIVRGPSETIHTRRIALLAAGGFVGASAQTVKTALEKAGATVEVVSTILGPVASSDGEDVQATRSLLTTPSVMYDAVLIADGARSVALLAADADARRFVHEAHQHCKTIAAIGTAAQLLEVAGADTEGDPGIITGHDAASLAKRFVAAIAHHRHWSREPQRVPSAG